MITTRQEVFSGAVGLKWLREQIEEHLACGSVFVPLDRRALEFVPRAAVEALIEEYRRAGWTKASIVGQNIVAIDMGEYEKPEGLVNLWDVPTTTLERPAPGHGVSPCDKQAPDSDLVLRTQERNMAYESGPDDGPGLKGWGGAHT